jgi:hypothetical protein
MPYMLLVMEPPGQRDTRTLPQGHEVYDRMVQFGERLKAKGVLKAYDSLGSVSKGTRVRVRNGKHSLVDGPFSEAKEIVGGFFLLDCSKDDAIRYATECPAAEFATIEVREVGPCWEK